MTFTFVDVEQGSAEWLLWRAAGIGASDTPTIMGQKPWKTPGELMHEKLTPHLRHLPSAAMRRGTEMEPTARAYYVQKVGCPVTPACVQSTEYPWLRASLDGINVDAQKLVEIKCGESVYRHTMRTRMVPEYYFGQLQHILEVTGFTQMDFWCYLPFKRPIRLSVIRDERYIDRLLRETEEFWTFIAKDVLARLNDLTPRTP